MRKATLQNSDILRVLALLGHGDSICICDAGLPIPAAVERIDLALKPGLPSFIDTLTTVLGEMQVERAWVATELNSVQPALHATVKGCIQETANRQNSAIELDAISHDAFKVQSSTCKAIIRTGECSPYANIILFAGVTF